MNKKNRIKGGDGFREIKEILNRVAIALEELKERQKKTIRRLTNCKRAKRRLTSK